MQCQSKCDGEIGPWEEEVFCVFVHRRELRNVVILKSDVESELEDVKAFLTLTKRHGKLRRDP